jgi:hypothetical protein
MTSVPKPSLSSPDGTEKRLDASSKSLPTEWIERLFDRLAAYYGSRFADMWRGCDLAEIKRVWAAELGAFSREELARGADACRTRDWPPTLPEFLKLCRPALDYERAWLEACEQMARRESGEDRWSTPAVYWAAVRIGRDLQALPYSAMKTRWATALDFAECDIRCGRTPNMVPAKLMELPNSGGTMVSRDEARRRLDEIKTKLGEKLRVVPQ